LCLTQGMIPWFESLFLCLQQYFEDLSTLLDNIVFLRGYQRKKICMIWMLYDQVKVDIKSFEFKDIP